MLYYALLTQSTAILHCFLLQKSFQSQGSLSRMGLGGSPGTTGQPVEPTQEWGTQGRRDIPCTRKVVKRKSCWI